MALTERQRLIIAAGITTDEELGGVYRVTDEQRADLERLGISDVPDEVVVPGVFYLESVGDLLPEELAEAIETERLRLLIEPRDSYEAKVARTRIRWLDSLAESVEPGHTMFESISRASAMQALRVAVDAELGDRRTQGGKRHGTRHGPPYHLRP